MSRRRQTRARDEKSPNSGIKPKSVEARTPNQKKYIKAIQDNHITLCYGPAGTGKTHVAAGLAIQMFRNNEIDKIVITRPAVDSGASIGYLPGTMEDKVGPYLAPLLDELAFYVERKTLMEWLGQKTLEIVPMPMMRGRTFNNTFAILDEAQNCERREIRMMLTRLGQGSKMVLVGDTKQSDLRPESQGAFSHAIHRLDGVEGVGIVELTGQDIVRHHLIQTIEERLA